MNFSRYKAMWLTKSVLLLVTTTFSATAWLCAQTSVPLHAKERVPVLVELFTSEGCSDCPPADTLLARLDATQFVRGAEAIVLSEHVTYWNYLGWRDPFSFAAMDQRQKQYVGQFRLEGSYTPQMVVDGAEQTVGSDAAAVSTAVAHAAATVKRDLAIQNAHWLNGALQFSVRGASDPEASLVAAVAQDVSRSTVRRGENAGKTLHHTAVVRAIRDYAGTEVDGRALRLDLPDAPHDDQLAGPFRLIVFLTDHKTRRVLAVAEQTLTR